MTTRGLRISPELLIEILRLGRIRADVVEGLPADARIVGANWLASPVNVIELRIQSATFKHDDPLLLHVSYTRGE